MKRFRWAVCQIDVLRRLRPVREVIQSELKNLPKTLYDVYNKIFASIPDEERRFVYLVLEWVSFHRQVHDNDIPCDIILQAVHPSFSRSNAAFHGRFYDQYTLRDVCGCLINFTEEIYSNSYKSTGVKLAHYTVREYLDWTHRSGANSTEAPGSHDYNHILAVVLEEAQVLENIRLWRSNLPSDDGPLDPVACFATPIWGNITGYCILSAILCLYRDQKRICASEELFRSVRNLLDPARSHFKAFCLAASSDKLSLALVTSNIYYEDSFWLYKFSDCTNVVAIQTFNLLLVEAARPKGTRFPLTRRHLQDSTVSQSLQHTCKILSRPVDGDGNDIKEESLHGSLFEIVVQLGFSAAEHALRLLLEVGAGKYNPSSLLLYYIGRHDHDCCGESCTLLQLLRLGADPNGKGYRVTPLQIATAVRDYEGIELLLKNEADPNGTGSSDGITWEEGSFLCDYCQFSSFSPLSICRNFEMLPWPGWDDSGAYNDLFSRQEEEHQERVEDILVMYGAREVP